MSEDLQKSLEEEIVSFKTKKQLEHAYLMENLFHVDKTLDDTLPPCTCGQRPRTRYSKGRVWIECSKVCGVHSLPETRFPLARNSWYYVTSR